MSNAFAPNRAYLCAERASHLTVKTYWLPVDVCGGGSLFDELGCLGHRGYTGIGSDRGDVNRPDNAIIGSSTGDDGAPYEWRTRMTGLLTRPRVRFTVATSPSGVSRRYWAAITSYPSA
jgi:hypothetical protein